MNNIKLTEKFLFLDKKNSFNEPNVEEVRKLLERQIKEIKEWKWTDWDLYEDYPFAIILEKKDNIWNKLEIFAWIDWDYFDLYLHVNKWIKSEFLKFFNFTKKKFSKELKTIDEVIVEVQKFSSKNEEIYRDEFSYRKQL